MTSRLRIALGTLGLVAAAGTGCGDSGPTGPSASSLIGTWNATKVEMVSLADTTYRIDGLEGGQTLVLYIYEDHSWESIQTRPGEPDFLGAGTWSLSGRTLTITADGEDPEAFRVSCDGSVMRLTLATTWDYDFDGTDEPARMSMHLLKDSAMRIVQ